MAQHHQDARHQDIPLLIAEIERLQALKPTQQPQNSAVIRKVEIPRGVRRGAEDGWGLITDCVAKIWSSQNYVINAPAGANGAPTAIGQAIAPIYTPSKHSL